MPPSSSSGKKAAASKRRSPSGSTTRKSPGKTSGAGTRKSAATKSRNPRSNSARSLIPPLAAVLFLAIVILSGLIYWGGGSLGFSFTRALPVKKATQSAEDSGWKKIGSPPAEKVAKPAGDSERKHGGSTAAEPVKKPPEAARERHVPPEDDRKNRKDAAAPKEEHKPEAPETSRGNTQLLALNTGGKTTSPPAPPVEPLPDVAPVLARAAIVIDDFGQDAEMAKRFLKIPLQITFSVLPFLPHSAEIAELAHAGRREVILHLPMEPQGYPSVNPGPGALLISMNNEKIHKAVRTALDTSPHYAGMNNHMGSRFTEHTGFMREVLSELRRRGLYFLDSCTSPQSVGYSLAQDLHISSRRRDIFLDHNTSEVSVRMQVNQFIRKAKIEGSAVAIGHPHESTLRVLEREAARFRQEGILIVPSGELMVNRWKESKNH